METWQILSVITVIFAVIGGALIPYLKQKGLYIYATLLVNVIEQVCDFMELQKMGYKKFMFVKRVLLMANPTLSEEELEQIIETIVAKMNELKGSK